MQLKNGSQIVADDFAWEKKDFPDHHHYSKILEMIKARNGQKNDFVTYLILRDYRWIKISRFSQQRNFVLKLFT